MFILRITGIALLNCVSWWLDLMYTNGHYFKGHVVFVLQQTASRNGLIFTSHFHTTVFTGSSLRVPAGGCHSGHGYLVQGGSLPVWFASLQYLSFRMNAAALGCLCLLKMPFLFPTTRVIPADTRRTNKNLVNTLPGESNNAKMIQHRLNLPKLIDHFYSRDMSTGSSGGLIFSLW